MMRPERCHEPRRATHRRRDLGWRLLLALATAAVGLTTRAAAQQQSSVQATARVIRVDPGQYALLQRVRLWPISPTPSGRQALAQASLRERDASPAAGLERRRVLILEISYLRN